MREGDGKPHHQRAHHRCRRPDRKLVTAQELARVVPRAAALGENRLTLQMTADILRKQVGGCIARLRILVKRLENDVVEVALQGSCKRADTGAAGLCRFGPHIAARRPRLGLENGVFERAARIALELIGPRSRQKLREQYTERIDIGCRADGASRDLFG